MSDSAIQQLYPAAVAASASSTDLSNKRVGLTGTCDIIRGIYVRGPELVDESDAFGMYVA